MEAAFLLRVRVRVRVTITLTLALTLTLTLSQVREAAILLKTWARQRSIGQAGCVSRVSLISPLDLPWISPGSPLDLLWISPGSPLDLPWISPVSRLYLGQAGCVSGFQLSLLLLHLLKKRKLGLQMGSYHIFRVALRFLASTDLSQQPIVLPAARDAHQAHPAEADPAKEGEEDGEAMGTAARAHAAAAARAAADAKAAEAAALFAPHFAWVLLDSEGCVNYGAGVGAGALQELRSQAGLSLALP